MAPNLKDPYGSTETTTEYEGQDRPSSSRGFDRSIWSAGLAAVFLIVILGWAFLWPHGGTDPAPNGSAGSGVVQQSGPASLKK